MEWHGDSWNRLSKYQFNTKRKDQLFCGKCGASLGIDFRDFFAPKEYPIGVNVRMTFGYNNDLTKPTLVGCLVSPGSVCI